MGDKIHSPRFEIKFIWRYYRDSAVSVNQVDVFHSCNIFSKKFLCVLTTVFLLFSCSGWIITKRVNLAFFLWTTASLIFTSNKLSNFQKREGCAICYILLHHLHIWWDIIIAYIKTRNDYTEFNLFQCSFGHLTIVWKETSKILNLIFQVSEGYRKMRLKPYLSAV